MSRSFVGLRVALRAIPALVLGFGIPYEVYRGSKDRNIELPMMLPELSDMEVEPYSPVQEVEQPVQRTTRKVGRQTAGRKFDSVFKVPKGLYSEAYLQGLCKSKIYIPVIFRNWCKEAKFELKEE